jgi:hypothetical protein
VQPKVPPSSLSPILYFIIAFFSCSSFCSVYFLLSIPSHPLPGRYFFTRPFPHAFRYLTFFLRSVLFPASSFSAHPFPLILSLLSLSSLSLSPLSLLSLSLSFSLSLSLYSLSLLFFYLSLSLSLSLSLFSLVIVDLASLPDDFTPLGL